MQHMKDDTSIIEQFNRLRLNQGNYDNGPIIVTALLGDFGALTRLC